MAPSRRLDNHDVDYLSVHHRQQLESLVASRAIIIVTEVGDSTLDQKASRRGLRAVPLITSIHLRDGPKDIVVIYDGSLAMNLKTHDFLSLGETAGWLIGDDL